MFSEKKEKGLISLEIVDLLNVPEKPGADEWELPFEEMLVSGIVDALVRYGKERAHIEKVSRISMVLCREMGMDRGFCTLLEKASLIYDIGNLRIDPRLYRKDNKLSFEEFEIVKQHTVIGEEILRTQGNALTDMAARISAEHHEWYDGSGYPYGRKGEDLSIEGRIVALADTAAALFSSRYGRVAMDFDAIGAHIAKRSALQFDPEVVERFMESGMEIRMILEEGRRGAA